MQQLTTILMVSVIRTYLISVALIVVSSAILCHLKLNRIGWHWMLPEKNVAEVFCRLLSATTLSAAKDFMIHRHSIEANQTGRSAAGFPVWRVTCAVHHGTGNI